jgi:hypothetical protein
MMTTEIGSIAAKQFFISKVSAEAELQPVKLSEIEEKMLYFTEVHPSLPDIYEINARFERDYDSDEYEAKIAGRLKKARDRDSHASPGWEKQWTDALDALKNEDHYILVLLCAFPEYRGSLLPTRRVRDFMIYIAVGIAVVFACVGIAIWSR